MGNLKTALILLVIIAGYGIAGTMDYADQAAAAMEGQRNQAVQLAERAIDVAETYQAHCAATYEAETAQ